MGGMVAESRRFSPGEEQQEAIHLHFQRPAPSASLPPPGKGLSSEGLPGSPPPRGMPGKAHSAFLGPNPPTSASRLWSLEGLAPGGGALDDQIGA